MTDSSAPLRKFEFVVEIGAADRAQALAVMASMRADVPLGVTVSCDYMGELTASCGDA